MKYPLYTIEDLKWVEKDGTYEISDFADFINGLVDSEMLGHEAEIGVANYVVANGTHALSDKQSNVLDIIVQKYAHEQCNRCMARIAMGELAASFDNGGYCQYCNHQNSKDTD